MVAFDFDKTLTKKDTLFGFYKAAHGSGWLFEVKRTVLLGFAAAYKLKLLSNTALKQAGIWLFLRGKGKREIEEVAKEYARTVEWNAVYRDHFLIQPEGQRVVVSASFEEYLRPLFPDTVFFGSKLRYNKGRVAGLERNLYGKTKVEVLQECGYHSFEAVYSDSKVDTPLFGLGEKAYLVQGDQVTELELGR